MLIPLQALIGGGGGGGPPLDCTWTVMLPDALLPGLGFVTVTPKFPADAAVPVAVSCVEETKVALSAVPPRLACAPCTKLLPLSVNATAPVVNVVGLTVVRTGIGFSSVTLLVPFALASAALTASTVTAFVPGTTFGAV